MRDIDLPLTETVSLTVNPAELDMSNAVDTGNGQVMVSLGEMMNSDIQESLKKARANGGSVLYATTSIEQKIEDLLLLYFMGPFTGHDDRRELFEREILQSSALSYSAKKALSEKVVNKNDLLKGKKKNRLQSSLRKIMEWRNAFAHGKIQHDSRKGVFVRYYAGEQKDLPLTDEFWDQVESVFHEAVNLVGEAIETLEQIQGGS